MEYSKAVLELIANYVFEPMMQESGKLANSMDNMIGTGEGRGIGLMLTLPGKFMVLIAFVLGNRKSKSAIEVDNYELKA